MFKFPVLDFDALNNKMNSLNILSHKKLSVIYESMGGEFYDSEKRIMKGARVALIGTGGLPFQIKDNAYALMGNTLSLEDLKNELYKMAGMSAGMSYMNPYNKSFDDLAGATLARGHNSVLHTLSFNILITGLTCGVEHEFSSQRDIVHLSRLTVAKTVAQKEPCLVLHNERYLSLYSHILSETDKVVEEAQNSKDWESLNLLYPTAKASGIILSGTFKNIQKLIALKDSGGKEDEFVSILKEIEKLFTWL